MTREKRPEDIATDALAVAAKKAEEGCEGCAAGYARLAIENGATENQVEAALSKVLSRGSLLKLIGVATAGIVAAPAGAALAKTQSAASSPSLTDPAAIAALASVAFATAEGKLLKPDLERRGHTYHPALSLASPPDSNGTSGGFLVFATPGTENRMADYAYMVYTHNAHTNAYTCVTSLVHFAGTLADYNAHKTQPVDTALIGKLMPQTLLEARNGQVVVVPKSKYPPPPPQGTPSPEYLCCGGSWCDSGYNDCLIWLFAMCCGSAGVACLFAGPIALECFIVSCAFCASIVFAYCTTHHCE